MSTPSTPSTLTRASASDTSVMARAHRRARTAALHRGPSIGLAFDAVSGTYRIAVSQTV
jgi:hypothetical protein